MTRQRFIAIIVLSIILILMSLGTILTKLGLKDVNPLTLTWTTVGIGILTMVIYTFFIRKEQIPHMPREIWLYIIGIGFFNFVIARYTLIFSLNLLPATTNTYLTNFVGFITMGMSIIILKETPTIFQVLGAIVAVIGMRIFFRVLAPGELLGVILVFIGIIGIAFTNNITRKLAIKTNNNISNNIVSTLAIIIGGSITVIVGIILDWPVKITGLANRGIILYIGIISIAFCLTVWNYNLRILRSYEASILGASSVIWTTVLAISILGEQLSLHQYIGMLLLFIGLVMVQLRSNILEPLFLKKAKKKFL